MNPITGLLAALAAITALFVGGWARSITASKTKARFPNGLEIFIGALTNFFDALGIGSYAPTTALFRFFRVVDDRVIPGTMTVGHTLPSVIETFIYTTVISVDASTLLTMIGSSSLGAWLGAGIVARWPKRKVQIGMGIALVVAASLMFMTQMKLFPGGGESTGVSGMRLVIAIAVNFILGALMTIGIGMFAPCMILVSLLGMNPKVAFPIMMGSAAFLMPVASIRFIREQSYSPRAAFGLLVGGIPAVFLAAYIIKELPLEMVRWLVIAVVIYTSASMLWSAFSERSTPPAQPLATGAGLP